MHKHFSVRVVTAAIIFIIALLGVMRAGADSASGWISSSLSLQKQADTQALPISLNGNIDCAPEDANNCAVSTIYGTAVQSTVRLNGTPNYRPVISYMDSRQHFLAVPNSNTAITYTTSPVYGFYLYFNYNFPTVIKDVLSFGTVEYQLTQPPDGKLMDKNSRMLPADYASMSFSPNGRWMVVSMPGAAMLRVNLQTFEVIPFAPGFNYSIGLDPSIKTAITNDGRYAVVSSKNFNFFKLYDLNTCAAVPDTITGPVGCQSRDLRAFMQQQLPGFSFMTNAKFSDDSTLDFYGIYSVNSANKTARFVLSTGNIANQTQYLALGDSYISGEGAFDYAGGTDTNTNKCHLSYLAYPFLIGRDLNFDSYDSVACSGAITDDILNTSDSYAGQADNKKIARADRTAEQLDSILASFAPGYINQLDFVDKYQPGFVMLSIGGNDMGFSKILTRCVEPRINNTCYGTYEDRLELVNQINTIVFPRLLQTYQKLKAAGPPDMRIYVIGYPQIAKPGGDCALNVHLNFDEVQFSQDLINYLDSVIQTAAAKTGVDYVDVQDALYGHRLCEAEPGSIAMNGLTAGSDRPTSFGGPIGDESYHPNPRGYQLLETKILDITHNMTDPMPAADTSLTIPAGLSQDILNAPHSGRATKVIEYDPGISGDLAYMQVPADISISGVIHSLKPNSALTAELHSTPTSLGSYITDGDGNLAAQVTIPADVPAGYHTIHFFGTDIAGQSVDIYKDLYVAAAADDLDGNGVADSTQACVGVPASGVDYDQDGIDDACDGDIALPPAVSASPSSSSPVPDLTDSPVSSDTPNQQGASNSLLAGSSQSDILYSNFDSSNPVVLADSTRNTRAAAAPEVANIQLKKNYYLAAAAAVIPALALTYLLRKRSA